MKDDAWFSIRQMIELTGLSEFTIRGWESRYSAFEPHRSESGRRQYSKADIERALLIRELLKRGHKIGKIAHLKNKKLQQLFAQSEQQTRAEAPSKMPDSVIQTLELVSLQKWSELALQLGRLPAKKPRPLIEGFFLPAVGAISGLVEQGLISVAQEHIFSSLLKEKIYQLLGSVQGLESGNPEIRFVLATPEGDFHEIGLLLAHLMIRSFGYTSLYLGPHTPARDLAETALRFEASHLLVVSTVSKKGGAKQELLSYVSEVHKMGGTKMHLWLAGAQAPRTQDTPTSFSVISSFDALENILTQLKNKEKT